MFHRQRWHDLAALEINSRSSNLHFSLDAAQAKAGHVMETRGFLPRGLRLQPEFPEARRLLDSLGQAQAAWVWVDEKRLI